MNKDLEVIEVEGNGESLVPESVYEKGLQKALEQSKESLISTLEAKEVMEAELMSRLKDMNVKELTEAYKILSENANTTMQRVVNPLIQVASTGQDESIGLFESESGGSDIMIQEQRIRSIKMDTDAVRGFAKFDDIINALIDYKKNEE